MHAHVDVPHWPHLDIHSRQDACLCVCVWSSCGQRQPAIQLTSIQRWMFGESVEEIEKHPIYTIAAWQLRPKWPPFLRFRTHMCVQRAMQFCCTHVRKRWHHFGGGRNTWDETVRTGRVDNSAACHTWCSVTCRSKCGACSCAVRIQYALRAFRWKLFVWFVVVSIRQLLLGDCLCLWVCLSSRVGV